MNRQKKYRHYITWFDNEDVHKDLKGKSIKGGISTSASQFIRFGLGLISTFVLARILLPSDFGLIGMVTAFTGFASIIQDMGLSMAVVQKEKITHKQVSNLFWVNVLVCFFIACIFGLLSPLIVALYHHNTQLYPIILSYAVGIFVGGFGIQHNALMTRKMLFTTLAKANVLATFLSVICGIMSALYGLGYWSIVVLNLSSTVFFLFFMWYFCNWRPSFPSKNQPIKDFLKFGAGISGFNIVNYFSRNSDDVLIGNQLGASAVGFYSKAYQLLMLPINQLRNPLMTVAIPAMSKLQHDPQRYISYYKKYVFLLAFFSMPLVACLAVFSKEIILIILGPHWIESSNIFFVLAFAGFIDPVASSSGLVMISSGQSKRFFVIGTISSVIIVLSFFIGIHWGVIGTALAFVIATYLLVIPVLIYAFRNTPLKVSYFFKEIALPVIHTVVMCALLLTAKILLKNIMPPLFILLAVLPVGIIFYYFSWKLYPHGKEKFENIESLIHIIVKKIKMRKETIKKELPVNETF